MQSMTAISSKTETSMQPDSPDPHADLPPNPLLTQTLERIHTRQACIGVMGLGYVGLPLLSAFYQAGFAVLGFDPDPGKLQMLAAGRSYIQDVPDQAIASMAADSRARFSAEKADLASADAILICVPTPLHKSKEPDLSYILAAAQAIGASLRPGQLVILESTTYPGTTDEILLPIFEAGGLKAGVDFMLAFSPERIDPGNRRFRVEDIPKVVGGFTPRCGEAAAALYGSIIAQIHPVSSPRVAETAKILENTFRSVNIALVNEFAVICRTLGVDVWEVIEAAATKPFGFMKFVPGPGIGGHCIPLDPHYLIWKSRVHGFEPRFMALADQINAGMPATVVQLVMEALNDDGKALKGARVLVLGVSYKSDVNDARESPAMHIIPMLQQKGARVAYHDPYVPSFALEDQPALNSQQLSAEALAGYDLGLILTAHSTVDYALLGARLPLLVDTRNILRQVPVKARVVYL